MGKTLRLVMIPAMISLGITLLRLFGELGRWSEKWFEPVTRGILPSAAGWIVGITWLAVPFGICFALQLAARGEGPQSRGKAVVAGFTGLLITILGLYLLVPMLNSWLHLNQRSFLLYLTVVWSFGVLATVPIFLTWFELAKTLLFYGWAARIPVAIIMLLAMIGNWGTHYDYVDVPQIQAIPIVERYIIAAFLPQLIFWVAFTVMLGGFCGSLAAAFFAKHRGKPTAGSTSLM